MPDENKFDRFWGDFLGFVFEFVPDEAGVGILGCIAAAFVLAGIIWIASRLWENILG